jgi:MFS transporter, SP family, sugar:H+ symporter
MIPLSLIYIVRTILAVGMFFIPESPRWLVQHGKVDKARKALRWLRPEADSIEAELKEMELAIENERMLERGIAVFDMFRGVDLRRTLVSVGAVSVQAACGVMFMLGECLPFIRFDNETTANNISIWNVFL